jgi:hypothetical protein
MDFRIKSFYATHCPAPPPPPPPEPEPEQIRVYARRRGERAVFLADPPLEDALAQVRAEGYPVVLALVPSTKLKD